MHRHYNASVHIDLRNSWVAMIFMAASGSFLLVSVLVFALTDGLLAYRARSFVPTPAAVTSFKVRELTNKGQTYYEPQIGYTYSFAGANYSGDRFAIDAPRVDLAGAQAYQATYFPRATITVYVDPSKPSVALVDRNPPPFLFLLGPVVGFAASTFTAAWFDLIDAILWRSRRAVAGGVYLRRTGKELRITMPPAAPIVIAAATALCCAIVSILGLFVWAALLSPGSLVAPALVATATSYVPALPVYIWARWTHKAGRWDIVISETGRTILLPATFGRKEPQVLPLARIVDVWDDVDMWTVQTKDGSATYAVHQPTIEWHSDVGRIHKEKIAEWQDAGKAKAFIRWLHAALIEIDRRELAASAPKGRQSLMHDLYTRQAREQ